MKPADLVIAIGTGDTETIARYVPRLLTLWEAAGRWSDAAALSYHAGQEAPSQAEVDAVCDLEDVLDALASDDPEDWKSYLDRKADDAKWGHLKTEETT